MVSLKSEQEVCVDRISSMQPLKNAEDKSTALRTRMEEQRKLGATIDALIRDADAEPAAGCGICNIWRRLGRRQRAIAIATATSGEAAGASTTANGVQTSSRLFGVRKADPHAALATAAQSMESRNRQLESRAASEREEAKRLMALGQKASAMRTLKKSKATEKQLEANQAALVAVEQQVDLMAQAAMQKHVATALASSSKGMKAQKKLLKNAESAVDDAQDARDMAEDLGNVMAEFGQNGNGEDDDELMAELMGMVAEAPSEPPLAQHDVGSSTAAAEAARLAEIAQLESKIKMIEEAKAVSYPSVPTTTSAPAIGKAKEEKARLLASCANSME